MQIYFFIKYSQVKIAKTLDFVNNSAFLLITQALKPFICGTLTRIKVSCISCIAVILRFSATSIRGHFLC